MGNSISSLVREILTPENSNSDYATLNPVIGTIKIFFWFGATIALVTLVARLQ